MSSEMEKNHIEEENLEYESDSDDSFEAQYVESQMGVNNETPTNDPNEKYNLENDNFSNDEYTNEDLEERRKQESQQQEHDSQEQYQEDILDEFNDDYEDNYDDENQSRYDNEDFPGEEAELPEEEQQHQIDLDNADNNEEIQLISHDDDNESGHEVNYLEHTENAEDETPATDEFETKPSQNNDPFDDDELIVYVDDPKANTEEETVHIELVSDSDRYTDDFDDENDIDFESLNKLPVYLDFCDLHPSDKSEKLESVCLNDKIKVDFDMMKLFPPNCDEDEMFSEFDSLYNSLEECVNLPFSQIFSKIMNIICLEDNENSDSNVEIRLIFADLLNFTISSDSISVADMALKDILTTYHKLKIQSPNPDLHKFLSIRVCCTETARSQLDMLFQASLQGYRLENLDTLIKNKKRLLKEIGEDGNNKRIKN